MDSPLAALLPMYIAAISELLSLDPATSLVGAFVDVGFASIGRGGIR